MITFALRAQDYEQAFLEEFPRTLHHLTDFNRRPRHERLKEFECEFPLQVYGLLAKS